MKKWLMGLAVILMSFSAGAANKGAGSPGDDSRPYMILKNFFETVSAKGPFSDWETGLSQDYPATTFNLRLRIDSGNLYDLADKVEFFITPIHDLKGPSDIEGQYFEFFVSGRGTGKSVSKNYQVYRIFEIALKRQTHLGIVKDLAPYGNLETYGCWLKISSQKEFEGLLNEVHRVIQEVNIYGHQAIIGPF